VFISEVVQKDYADLDPAKWNPPPPAPPAWKAESGHVYFVRVPSDTHTNPPNNDVMGATLDMIEQKVPSVLYFLFYCALELNQSDPGLHCDSCW
jgi:hypothetical protein